MNPISNKMILVTILLLIVIIGVIIWRLYRSKKPIYSSIEEYRQQLASLTIINTNLENRIRQVTRELAAEDAKFSSNTSITIVK